MGDKQNLAKESQLALKQDLLIAGSNITIASDGKTISAANPTSVTVTPVYQAGTLVAAIIINGNATNIYTPAQHGDNANQNLALSFSSSQTYNVGDYVIYQENLYQCITAISTPADWDSTKWTRALITDVMGQGGDYANQNIANTYDTTSTYNVGDYVIYTGLLYKCITAVETPGPFNINYWTHVLIVDEMGSGGGGSGDVTDVYVNGQSVLDVNKIAQIINYKEVTKAEYDALPASKESNDILYCIKDQIASVAVAPIVYSEEEREVGVWTNGKPLYQKTIYTGALVNSSTKTIPHNISNIDLAGIADVKGVLYNPNNYSIMLPRVHDSSISNQIFYEITNTNIIIYNRGLATASAFTQGVITIQYTKTTDQPGSGAWAQNGVPAVHYSENEQVVGTWIDGSTVYERVINLTTAISVASNTWVDVGVSVSYASKFINGTVIETSGTFEACDVGKLGTGNLAIRISRTIAGTAKSIIIRYTKSSS